LFATRVHAVPSGNCGDDPILKYIKNIKAGKENLKVNKTGAKGIESVKGSG
jgi:hypothetical protein